MGATRSSAKKYLRIRPSSSNRISQDLLRESSIELHYETFCLAFSELVLLSAANVCEFGDIFLIFCPSYVVADIPTLPIFPGVSRFLVLSSLKMLSANHRPDYCCDFSRNRDSVMISYIYIYLAGFSKRLSTVTSPVSRVPPSQAFQSQALIKIAAV